MANKKSGSKNASKSSSNTSGKNSGKNTAKNSGKHTGKSAAKNTGKDIVRSGSVTVEIHPSQLAFGTVVHYLTMISCFISILVPIFILVFPKSNILNPNLIFNTIFEGGKVGDIWEAAGVPFVQGSFWRVLFSNLFTPDGFATLGIVIGCSVSAWGLIPALAIYFKKKDYLFSGICLFVFALIFLAMSGIINMAA